MTDASSISAAPIVTILQPYINAVVTALVGLAVTYFIALVHRWTGRAMADADQAKLRQAAQDAAGMVVANAEAGISSVSIHSSDPRIAAAASKAIAMAPGVAAITGFTPDAFNHMITAEVGKLQAQSPTTAAAAVVTPAAGEPVAAIAGAVPAAK